MTLTLKPSGEVNELRLGFRWVWFYFMAVIGGSFILFSANINNTYIFKLATGSVLNSDRVSFLSSGSKEVYEFRSKFDLFTEQFL